MCWNICQNVFLIGISLGVRCQNVFILTPLLFKVLSGQIRYFLASYWLVRHKTSGFSLFWACLVGLTPGGVNLPIHVVIFA